jgi:hypothetical protein
MNMERSQHRIGEAGEVGVQKSCEKYLRRHSSLHRKRT